MQLLPRYLVNNTTTVIADMAGFITEYRPVYSRHIQVYRGIDNVLDFKLVNADQKPITTLANYTAKFQAFDEAKNLIVEHNGVIVNASKGLFKVTISANDLLNIQQQYLSYNIHLLDSNSDAVLTYSGAHFANDGIIFVSDQAFPGPRDTQIVDTFLGEGGAWSSESVNAEPGVNGNEALHTAVVYTDSYVGDVVVQATLDNQIIGDTVWADVTTVTLDGTESEPTPVNYNGVFTYVRFKTTADPLNKISKILVRN
jgi:hypothetical protein